MKKELPKVYEPQQVEDRIYKMWEDADCFNGDPDPKKKPFSIVMPPPNVTGQLHMGHAIPPSGSPAPITPASPPRSRWRRSCAPRRA